MWNIVACKSFIAIVPFIFSTAQPLQQKKFAIFLWTPFFLGPCLLSSRPVVLPFNCYGGQCSVCSFESVPQNVPSEICREIFYVVESLMPWSRKAFKRGLKWILFDSLLKVSWEVKRNLGLVKKRERELDVVARRSRTVEAKGWIESCAIPRCVTSIRFDFDVEARVSVLHSSQGKEESLQARQGRSVARGV